MTLKKNDFLEIEFTGKIKDGGVFDSNIKEDLKELNPEAEAKPFVFALGEDMFLKGVDEFLIGKDLGKHSIELTPEKAFGKRDPKLITRLPTKTFTEHKMNPVQGMSFNFDGKVGRILAVSGGRVIVDFNNPLAGKDIIYDVNVLRKVDDLNEKTKALNEFFFRKEIKFEIKDKKLILEVEQGFDKFAELFKDKYKELLNLDLETKVNKVEKTK